MEPHEHIRLLIEKIVDHPEYETGMILDIRDKYMTRKEVMQELPLWRARALYSELSLLMERLSAIRSKDYETIYTDGVGDVSVNVFNK